MSVAVANPYRRPCRVCLTMGLLLAIGLVLVAVMVQTAEYGKPNQTLLAVTFGLGFVAFPLLFGAYVTGLYARAVNRFIKAIEEEEYLVHWTYLPEEWQVFQEAETPLLKRDFRQIVINPLLIGLPLVVGLLLLMVYSEKEPDTAALLFSLGMTVGILGAMIGLGYYIRVVRRRSWARKQFHAPPDTYIHRSFAHANGEFIFFAGFNQQLVDVQLHSLEPATIEFTIRNSMPKGGYTLEPRRVLVPWSQLQRAGEVVAAVRASWGLG